MLRPAPGKRLHLVLGSPAKQALGALGALGRDVVARDLWSWKGELEAGDVVLTVLDSRPRMFAMVETLSAPVKPRTRTMLVDKAEPLLPLVSVEAVKRRIGAMPPAPGPVPATLAPALLQAIEEEIASPTPLEVVEGARSCSSTRARSSGLQMQALSASAGVCTGCERDFSLLAGAGATPPWKCTTPSHSPGRRME